MAATTLKLKSESLRFNEPKENVGPGQAPLYFKNVGLFSDPYLTKLNEPNKDEFMNKHWETEALPAFNETYEWMLSTWEEMKDVLPTLSEAQLENKWIQPILAKLGWEYEVQDRLKKWGKTEIPDYSLFDSKKTYLKAQGCKTDEAYFEHVLAVADAKQMGVSLDGSKLDKSNPSYQIIWYQQITGKNWGVLTDGRYWRLYSLRSKSKFTSYYEINIEKMLVERDDEQFKYFFNFFRKDALAKLPSSEQCFLDVVFDKGERYAREVETRLKVRAFHLVEQICNGFLSEIDGTPSEKELTEIYENSLHYLFRLMFILNCEAKGLLNVDKQSHYYVHSLRNLSFQIKNESESNISWSNQPRSYSHISMLFSLLEKGDSTIGIHGFGDEIFSNGNKRFYKDFPIPDSFLNPVLLELAFASDDKEKELRLIDYKRLSADHLGSLFEGLLEFHIEKSGRSYVLVNSSGERKTTGSFYTPEHIVDYIVGQTLDPIVKDLSPKEILSLRILDPSMGSGHFLLGVIKYLESKLIEKISETSKSSAIDPFEVRWQILHSCVYGVDINPLAVDLAKYSLWIYSARNNQKLEPLNDQLKFGNSLISDKRVAKEIAFDWSKEFSEIKHFSAVVGNPPYVFARDKKFSEIEKAYLGEKFKWSRYQLNIAQSFVELSLALVEESGKVGLILPNTWLTIQSSDSFREGLLQNCSELVVTNSLDKIFQDASVDNAIIIATKSEKSKSCSLTTQLLENGEFSIVNSKKKTQPSGDIINCRKAGGRDLVTELSLGTVDLESLFEVKTGLVAYEVGKGSPKQTEEMKENRIYHSDKKKNKDYRIYLDGRDVQRFNLDWSGQYLMYGPNLAAPRNKELYEIPRVLVRQIPSKPPYCMNSVFVCGNEVNDRNSMIVSVGSEEDGYLVAGVLNSKIVSEWFVQKFDKFQRKTFPQIKSGELGSFPFPREIKPSDKIELISLSRKLHQGAKAKGVDSRTLVSLNEKLDVLVEKMFVDAAKSAKKKVA
jgi:type I restriction-modification system DNA methylase subunit